MRGNRGFTLIEVLVALVIVSVGLLGIAGMQASSIRSTYSAYLRSQATIQASEMLDRMRANRDAATGGDYDVDFGDDAPTKPTCTTCSETQIANWDLADWLGDLADRLPQGDGAIAVDTDDIATVSVRWSDSRQSGDLLTLSLITQL